MHPKLEPVPVKMAEVQECTEWIWCNLETSNLQETIIIIIMVVVVVGSGWITTYI